MSTGMISWSTTAASNATADSTVNWAEGMAPSAVNDSARAEMASAAKFLADIKGGITTGGTSTAYTVTSNQTHTATVNGPLAFVPHATNGATVTIAVDSIGAKPLRYAPGIELPAGVLVAGTPYTATYYTSNSGEWILHGFYSNPYSIPIGGFLPYAGGVAPSSSFVLPSGQAINRSTYAALYALTGNTYGAGDGSTTFNVPDLRGRAVFGHDSMNGSAAGRLTAAGGVLGTIGTAGGAETHTLSIAELPVVTPAGTIAVTVNDAQFASVAVQSGAGASRYTNGSNSAGITASATFTGTPFGSGTAHSIMPPAIVLPFIMRVI